MSTTPCSNELDFIFNQKGSINASLVKIYQETGGKQLEQLEQPTSNRPRSSRKLRDDSVVFNDDLKRQFDEPIKGSKLLNEPDYHNNSKNKFINYDASA